MTLLAAPAICLVTSRRRAASDARTDLDALVALERLLDEAIDAGIDLIQIRERDVDARPLRDFVARVVRRAEGRPTRVVVNDCADVAVAAGAHGVHLRGDGPAAAEVRSLGPDVWIVGRSVHAADEAGAAGDADYVAFGTVFPSSSKAPDAPVAGVDALRLTVAAARVPVLAIGGVTPERAALCRDAGAAGIAAITPFLPPGRAPGALGPAAALRAFRDAWGQGGRPRA